MDAPPSAAVLVFAGVTVDGDRGCLRRPDGAEVPLAPKPFALLMVLARNAGRTMSKEALLEAVWPGVNVTEDSLFQAVREARRAIGDEAGSVLRSVPRRGYLLDAAVTGAEAAVTTTGLSASPLAPPADRPSLVVLPFQNMSGDPEQDYFADGVVEDITAALARIRWLFVIGRNSAFTYKGRAVDLRDVGRELGVRYVIQGSVRRAAERVRIGCQIIEAESAGHIWSDRFEGDLTDVFKLQDQVSESVASAIEPNLRRAEIERARRQPTDSLHAYDLYLRALPNFYGMTQEGTEEALRLLQRAVELDPGYARAKAFAAMFHASRFSRWWGDDAAEKEASIRLAREALHDAQDDPEALRAAGYAISYVGREHEVGVTALDRAILLSGGGSAPILSISGRVNHYAGNWRKAIEHFHHAIRLSPIDPELANIYMGLSNAHLRGEQNEEAVDWARRAVQLRPRSAVGLRLLVSSLANTGRLEEARAACRTLLDVLPSNYSIASNRTRLASRNPEFVERFLNGLRIAGVPE